VEDRTDELLDAITGLIPPLLNALDALAYAGRHLHPPDLPGLVGRMAGFGPPLAAGLARFEAAAWPDHLGAFALHCRTAAHRTLEALETLQGSLDRSNPTIGAYRALGLWSTAVEALYPVALMLPPVNRFFLEPGYRDDEALQARLLQAAGDGETTGVMHAENEPTERGGCSVYVPEYYRSGAPMPLVVALHGGSGHGRGFLWTWLAHARSWGAILVAPTSRGETWSLMGPEVDTASLHGIVERVRSLWNVDPARILLTGMSDGGTFSLLAGLRDDSPFTHLAPISAAFHPMLLEVASPERLRGLPIWLVHGALDWMFPAHMARMAHAALAAAGVNVIYQELADLSHTYPREQNALILDWLIGVGPVDGR
jgi:phospholipase/carboxylesterase